jgi:hypothetical protein
MTMPTATNPTTATPTTGSTVVSASEAIPTEGSGTASAGTSGPGDPSTGTTEAESDSTPLLDVGADTDNETGEIVTCDDAANKPSNLGCEFWAVDMDQQDGFSDPASMPWGVAISPAGFGQTEVTIEINLAAPGQPLDLMVVKQLSIGQDEVVPVELPIRELDCGTKPNDYMSPGTCLSSRAFRITTSAPAIVYQFNVFKNAFSNDASLLLPTPALGKRYRVVGWPAGHPIKILNIIDRAAITIVGTEPDTTVTVLPRWRIKGNPPIAAAKPGEPIVVTLGPFDVLNLETDDATFQDDTKTMADLSGSTVVSDKPVAVFSGVETTSAPGGVIDIPTYPGWTDEDTCCLDHLEEQLFPVESLGTKYVITRSPIRSSGSYHEPDVIRFVGAAEDSAISTSLPAPFDKFLLKNGEVRTTWADADFVATGSKPFLVAQLQISQEYIEGNLTGDPSLTVFPGGRTIPRPVSHPHPRRRRLLGLAGQLRRPLDPDHQCRHHRRQRARRLRDHPRRQRRRRRLRVAALPGQRGRARPQGQAALRRGRLRLRSRPGPTPSPAARTSSRSTSRRNSGPPQ